MLSQEQSDRIWGIVFDSLAKDPERAAAFWAAAGASAITAAPSLGAGSPLPPGGPATSSPRSEPESGRSPSGVAA